MKQAGDYWEFSQNPYLPKAPFVEKVAGPHSSPYYLII